MTHVNDNAIRAGEPPSRPARPLESKYRKLSFVCILLVTLFTLACLPCLLPSEFCRIRFGRPYVTWDEYREIRDKIIPGMTFDQVELAIGAPHEKLRGGDGTASWW